LQLSERKKRPGERKRKETKHLKEESSGMLECNLASGCTVDVAGIQGWQAGRRAGKQAGNAQFRSSVLQNRAFQTFFLAYNCNNTKHASVPLGTANINAYFQDIDLLGCFAVETSNFAVAAFLI
jgi:hypothetical protein